MGSFAGAMVGVPWLVDKCVTQIARLRARYLQAMEEALPNKKPPTVERVVIVEKVVVVYVKVHEEDLLAEIWPPTQPKQDGQEIIHANDSACSWCLDPEVAATIKRVESSYPSRY